MLDKYINYTKYMLTQRRGILLKATAAEQEPILKALKDEYRTLVIYDYAKFAEMDTKKLKNYNLFVFPMAHVNLNKWSKKATQKLSRMTTRARRFVFIVAADGGSPLEACYILAKCTERSVADLKHRFCDTEPAHDGALRYTKYTIPERTAEYNELLLDHTVDTAHLYAEFSEEEEHSRFGPSGLAHLAKCPGSLWIDDKFERSEGAAMLGSLWHKRAELAIRNGTDTSLKSPVHPYVQRARFMMIGCLNGVEEWHKDEKVHPEFSGTCDFWAYDPREKWLYVMDYKNGKYPVAAKDNAQLKAYACLIADKYKLKPKTLALAVAQRGKDIDIWDVEERDVLPKWRAELKDIIGRALEAEVDPYQYLNHKECYSAFCPARDIHKEAREIYVKEKTGGASDAIARLRADKKARLVRSKQGSGVPDPRVAG